MTNPVSVLYFPNGTTWAPEWKIVSDGLPEPGFFVIGVCHVAMDDGIDVVPAPVKLIVGIDDGEAEYCWYTTEEKEVVVSHWMEFPPPPPWDYQRFYDGIPEARGL